MHSPWGMVHHHSGNYSYGLQKQPLLVGNIRFWACQKCLIKMPRWLEEPLHRLLNLITKISWGSQPTLSADLMSCLDVAWLRCGLLIYRPYFFVACFIMQHGVRCHNYCFLKCLFVVALLTDNIYGHCWPFLTNVETKSSQKNIYPTYMYLYSCFLGYET